MSELIPDEIETLRILAGRLLDGRWEDDGGVGVRCILIMAGLIMSASEVVRFNKSSPQNQTKLRATWATLSPTCGRSRHSPRADGNGCT
jgi:hypothetical protein